MYPINAVSVNHHRDIFNVISSRHLRVQRTYLILKIVIVDRQCDHRLVNYMIHRLDISELA